MRWLIVLPFERPGLMGMDFAEELAALGHEVRTFAYRRDNPLYNNRGTKALYQRWLLGRLERLCHDWRPAVLLVIKGGPLAPDVLERVRRRFDVRAVNVFPDNPLWMIPFECIEAYDAFFTKERYALRCLQQAGLRNLHYLPMYCTPRDHHPVDLDEDERGRFAAPLSFVGSLYPYRERLVRELTGYPLRLWGPGWTQARDPDVRQMVAGPAVYGRDKLCVYSGSTLSLNPHHPMNDIVGVNTRTFELAAAGACQVVDLKEDLGALFKPGEEVVAYRDLGELRRQLDDYLAHSDEARAIGANARRRALGEHTVRHRLDEVLAVLGQRFGLTGRPSGAHQRAGPPADQLPRRQT
jgi:spore maturation protein CgeB